MNDTPNNWDSPITTDQVVKNWKVRLLLAGSNLGRITKRAGLSSATPNAWKTTKRAAPEIEFIRNLMDAGGLNISQAVRCLPEEGWAPRNSFIRSYLLIEQEVQREEYRARLSPEMINANIDPD
jgi:hypothetical protein